MNNKNVLKIIDILEKEYPNSKCSLDYKTNFELLVAVMLSAQCTDERVNIVTSSLFKKYNTTEKIANIEIEELEKYIRPCGFYKIKAKNIHNMSLILLNKYGRKGTKFF